MFVAAVAANYTGSHADPAEMSACVGYLVAGAGTAGVNGCYIEKSGSKPRMFVLDSGHMLYSWKKVWRLGESGSVVTYETVKSSALPPESNGGCGDRWVQATGADPCPAIVRSNLPPISPTPPPLPSPQPTPAPVPPTPGMRLVWEDDFNGTQLNRSRWNVLEQLHRGGVYTKENVHIEGGALVLRTVAQNFTINGLNYFVSSGAVNTSGLAEQKYGRWEVRVKLPMVGRTTGYTLHSSIWLFDDAKNPQRSGCSQEIDVVEQYTSGSSTAASKAVAAIHPFNGSHAAKCTKVPYHRGNTVAQGDWSSNWTTFAVDWTEDWIVMRVNDEPYAVFGPPATEPWALRAFTDPLFLALTACVMDREPPSPDDEFPQEYMIDWVKVYEWT
jgi:beta-glucanase (GH16 family)